MSGHTPGPWNVVDGYYPSFREINGPSFRISIVMSAADLDFSDYLRREADARLIAAAPDLLDELENCADLLGLTFRDVPADSIIGVALTKARAAITKATGGAA